MMTLPADLLERDLALAAAAQAVVQTQAGAGRCIVVCGEAGIGKTSLLGALAATAGRSTRWLQAGCDALHTPRPLGPLLDLAPAWPASLGEALHAAHTFNGLFPSLLDWLRGQQPAVVLAIEDLHWADEATLDCVRYLGRRIADAGFTLIVTLRRDARDSSPPLRQTLAALDPAVTVHVDLEPLSTAAVAELAGRQGRDATGLHALTGGNPFYLQQLLRVAPGTLPRSLQDAVLAQAAALGPTSRDVLDTLALSPGGLELAHLMALHPGAAEALGDPAAATLLNVRPPWIALRHELARRILEDAVPPLRRWQRHQQLLARLATVPPHRGLCARQVHHAAAAGLSAEVWAMAPAAAQEAESVAANRAAARLLQLALEHAGDAPPSERAPLLDRLARCLHAIDAREDAVAARRQAIELQAQAGDVTGHAFSLAHLAIQLSPGPLAVDLAARAVAELAGQQASATKALACSALAISLANAGRAEDALLPAQEGLRCAEACGDADARLHAAGIAASIELSLTPSADAFDRLEGCIAEALRQGRSDRVAVPTVNLASVALVHGEYRRVLDVTERGIAYCVARDMDVALAHLVIRRALAQLELALWADARATLTTLGRMPSIPAQQAASAAILSSRLEAWLGGPNDEDCWQAHLDTAAQGRSDLLPTYVINAACEAAWLRGDIGCARRLAESGLVQAEGPWVVGHLRQWLRICGGQPPAAAQGLSAPQRACEAGQWRRAHELWSALGCRLDAALALLEGDTAAHREALAAFAELGCEPAVQVVRRQLLAAGARDVARGPYAHARTDPLGLSRRERQIAELLAGGLSNLQIAERLHRSDRTVAHHVSAVLAKLGVASRADVAGRLAAAIADAPVLPVGQPGPSRASGDAPPEVGPRQALPAR